MENALAKQISDVRFDALRNAIYHSARAQFLDRGNKFFSLVVILAAASAVGDIWMEFGVGPQWFALLATVGGAAQLVFDFSVRARNHDFLQHRYYELIAKITVAIEPSQQSVAEWCAELYRIYADEPSPMRALDAIAYNAACESMGKTEKRIKISWYQSWFRHVCPFNESAFPYVAARVNASGTSSI